MRVCLSSFHQFYLFNDDNDNNTANIRNAFSEKYGLQTTLRVAGIAGVLGRRGQQISHTPHMRLCWKKNELPFILWILVLTSSWECKECLGGLSAKMAPMPKMVEGVAGAELFPACLDLSNLVPQNKTELR